MLGRSLKINFLNQIVKPESVITQKGRFLMVKEIVRGVFVALVVTVILNGLKG